MGARLSHLTAARLDADAVVSYYGGGLQKHLSHIPVCVVETIKIG